MKNLTKTKDLVAAGLARLLANTYALMAQTQLAHWNVEGPDFFALHPAFQTQYEALFAAVDELAERTRALGHFAAGGLENLAALSDLAPAPKGAQTAAEFVALLIAGHEKTAAAAKALQDEAGAAGDLETQDLAIGRRTEHQKTLWMLRSYLK